MSSVLNMEMREVEKALLAGHDPVIDAAVRWIHAQKPQ